MTQKRTSLKPDSKTAWKARNDRGPHIGVFPTGAVLEFLIADTSMLLRSGRLTGHLKETALLVAAHPRGADGYMEELVLAAIQAGERSEMISQAIEDGIGLSHVLVSEMLVRPQVSAEEVAEGAFHELDIRMLLEFAERRRNTDAAGNKLPIIVLEQWAGFRDELAGPAGARDGGANGAEPAEPVPGADGDEL